MDDASPASALKRKKSSRKIPAVPRCIHSASGSAGLSITASLLPFLIGSSLQVHPLAAQWGARPAVSHRGSSNFLILFFLEDIEKYIRRMILISAAIISVNSLFNIAVLNVRWRQRALHNVERQSELGRLCPHLKVLVLCYVFARACKRTHTHIQTQWRRLCNR